MTYRVCRPIQALVFAATVLLPAGAISVQAAGTFKLPVPSHAQIVARLAHTHEIGSPGTTFRIVGKPLTILDGRGGGTLTAVIGSRIPAADGKGQVVFFWHNKQFNSLNADYETATVNFVKSPAPGTYLISYARYKATDPLCCPSVAPLKVAYGWSGRLLISNGVPPKYGSRAIRVQYQP